MAVRAPGGGESRPRLVALTPEASAAIGGAELVVTSLPFRIGRESRRRAEDPGPSGDARRHDSLPTNELYLPDKGETVNVSREHLQIEQDGAGYQLVDRGSTCGTIVEGHTIGGRHTGAQAPLHDGDVIIVGSSTSPWVFKFRL